MRGISYVHWLGDIAHVGRVILDALVIHRCWCWRRRVSDVAIYWNSEGVCGYYHHGGAVVGMHVSLRRMGVPSSYL